MEQLGNNLYAESLKAALKVGFISSSEELKLYATAIHNAMVWGDEDAAIPKDIEKGIDIDSWIKDKVK